MRTGYLTVAAGALLMASGAAFAQTPVTATADLDLHAGPAPDYEIVGAVDVNGEALLHGCLEATDWCEVSYNGMRGWTYADALLAYDDGVEVPVAELRIPVIVYEEPVEDLRVGSVVREFIAPEPEIRTYIETHTLEPVRLEERIVVGSTLPETVEIYEVPDYEYRYVYVNDQRLLVEPDTRRVVYIVE